jgi:hypothetical protein
MEKPKEPKNEWQDIYGETEVAFGPGGKVKITKRKSGEVTERVEKIPESAYDKLNDFEKGRVAAEMKKFEEKTPEMFRKGWSLEEINEEREKIKKEMSERILKLQEENRK